MNLPHFQTTIFPRPVTHSYQPFFPVKCCFRRKTNPVSHRIIPARDRAIDFGKFKGKMLGTLPSSYLKWVSKNLRARDFEEWAKLADQVLQDPIYQDRIEWEFAENLLHGNQPKALSSSSRDGETSAVAELMEISERFGWDNEDKVGWGKINFELLGTSQGGRIPKLEKREERDTETETLAKQKECGLEEVSEVAERRRERRERQKKMTRKEESNKSGIKEKGRGSFGNGIDGEGDVVIFEYQKKNMDDAKRRMGQNGNPFPGREALLRKALNRRRFVS